MVYYHPIISYQRIEVYMVKIIDMGRSHWNNGAIGVVLISISNTVIIVRDNIP